MWFTLYPYILQWFSLPWCSKNKSHWKMKIQTELIYPVGVSLDLFFSWKCCNLVIILGNRKDKKCQKCHGYSYLKLWFIRNMQVIHFIFVMTARKRSCGKVMFLNMSVCSRRGRLCRPPSPALDRTPHLWHICDNLEVFRRRSVTQWPKCHFVFITGNYKFVRTTTLPSAEIQRRKDASLINNRNYSCN